MPISLRLRLRSRRREAEVELIALVNTGFISESPDVMLPTGVASELGLWPPPEDALMASADTAGGGAVVYVVPGALEVSVVEEDRTVGPVMSNAVVNPSVNRVLISDYLAEELRIQVLYPRRGLWRFSDDEPGRLRRSHAVEGL